jgi:splicing factor, arginine/serine-rich 2
LLVHLKILYLHLILFCRFYDKRDAEDALDAMDGRILDGRELRVQMARYGRPSSPYRRHGRYD